MVPLSFVKSISILNNRFAAGRKTAVIPRSSKTLSLLTTLYRIGLISGFRVISPFKLEVWFNRGVFPSTSNQLFKLISTSSKPVFVGPTSPLLLRASPLIILSTPSGLKTSAEAVSESLGGLLLLEVQLF